MGAAALASPVLGAGISAVGGLAGALVGSHGASKGADAAAKANADALAFEREKEATRKQEYDRAVAQYQAQWNAWNANRAALAHRYGVNIPMAAPGPTAGPSHPALTLGGLSGGPAASPRPLMGAPVQPPPSLNATLGSLDSWNRGPFGNA